MSISKPLYEQESIASMTSFAVKSSAFNLAFYTNQKYKTRTKIDYFAENEAVFDDADCDEAVSYSSWGPCQPFCKKSADQRGTQTRNVRFKSTEAKQMCEVSVLFKITNTSNILNLFV